jgi:Tol biopolymer transport system component
MSLQPGQSLGHYRVTAILGAGGMGEVYLALDENLGRNVAIKVLPEELATDAERLARLKREAQLLASLNHPNIAAIHGLEEEAGRPFLVLELVEGQNLAERLKRGPIALDEALRLALQVAEGLEAAHEKGIVHRDLKPANITLTPAGEVKVLDFGLAKAHAGDAPSGSADRSQSPTLAHAGSMAGMILGTAAYMSPEQARGKPVDRRADVWAFGVVLYEMLTGRALFAGETVSDILAAVLTRDDALASLPDRTPSRVRELVRRCLVRDPRNRLQSIGDARIALQEAIADPGMDALPAAKPRSSGRAVLAWAPWLLALGLGLALAVRAPRPTGPAPAPAVITAVIPAPAATAFDIQSLAPASAALSPDGSMIAFGAQEKDGGTLLFVRRLADGQVLRLAGTAGVQYPFWSPDGRWVAFFTQLDSTLKRVPAAGGAPLTVCKATNGKGGSWGVGDTILFSPTSGAPIHRVPAAGGEPAPVTEIDAARHNSHRHPRFLPDGRHFLYLARAPRAQDSAVMLASLDGGAPRELMRSVTQAEYASGRLLFVRESVLLAQAFDVEAGRLLGDPEPVAEGVAESVGAAVSMFTTSSSGVLAFHSGETQAPVPLQWRDRAGVAHGSLGAPGIYRDPEFSPDGRRLAVSRAGQAATNPDIWLLDPVGGAETRFTFDPAEEMSPAWSADGGTVFFGSNASGPHHIYGKSVVGAGEAELVYGGPGTQFPIGASPDGSRLIFTRELEERVSLGVLDLSTREARPLRDGTSNDRLARVSRDGRWLLYESDESGRSEIYVTAFPNPGRSWQISSGGGRQGLWRGDGREIVYADLDGMMRAVTVSADGDAIRVGTPQDLFRSVPPRRDMRVYTMTPDAQRFLFAIPGVFEARNELRIVVNWPGRLRP